VPTLTLHRINRDSAGKTTSWTKNPPEEWNSAGNYQLVDKESTQGRGFYRESPDYLCRFRPARSKCTENPLNSTIPGSAAPNPIY
jgi:hypothetical protein